MFYDVIVYLFFFFNYGFFVCWWVSCLGFWVWILYCLLFIVSYKGWGCMGGKYVGIILLCCCFLEKYFISGGVCDLILLGLFDCWFFVCYGFYCLFFLILKDFVRGEDK